MPLVQIVNKLVNNPIYFIFLKILTIKTILSLFSRPLIIFAIAAGLFTAIGLTAFITGFINYSKGPSLVYFSVGLLYTTLAIVLLSWGILGELIYRTGDLKLEHFAQIKRTHRDNK